MAVGRRVGCSPIIASKRLGLCALARSALAVSALGVPGAARLRRRRRSRLAGEGARPEDIELIRRSLRPRPAAARAIPRVALARRCAATSAQSLYFKTDVLGLDLDKLPTTLLLGILSLALRARDLDSARRLRRRSIRNSWIDRLVPGARGGRAGLAELLLRAAPDHAVLDLAALAAGLRQRAPGRISSCRRSRSAITSRRPSCGSCAPA